MCNTLLCSACPNIYAHSYCHGNSDRNAYGNTNSDHDSDSYCNSYLDPKRKSDTYPNYDADSYSMSAGQAGYCV